MRVLGGVAAGAGLMYLLDPERGRRRRALVRDQLLHARSKAVDAVDATARDLRNRSRGVAARMGGILHRDAVSDRQLEERVRAKLGRYVSHPAAIEVAGAAGTVTLSGPILDDEATRLLRAVRRIPGVLDLVDALERHQQAGDVPALQGGRARPGSEFELAQANWAPATRLLVGTAGGALAVLGGKRGGLGGAALGTLGLGLLARSVTNLEPARLLGVGAGRRAVDLRKTLHVAAPVEEVFEFWRRVENFPRFMSHVREVRDAGSGLTHWRVAGPGGVDLEWDAETTRLEPNRLLAWKTLPGSAVGHAGIVRFEPEAGGTRVDVQMTYNPPGGGVGHALASLLGGNPKLAMDEDLVRFKSLLEDGKTSAKGQSVALEEVEV